VEHRCVVELMKMFFLICGCIFVFECVFIVAHVFLNLQSSSSGCSAVSSLGHRNFAIATAANCIFVLSLGFKIKVVSSIMRSIFSLLSYISYYEP